MTLSLPVLRLWFPHQYAIIIGSTVFTCIFQEHGEQSAEWAHVPGLCPRFISWMGCHVWVEFVVGSCPYSEGFSPASPQNQQSNKPNSSLIWMYLHLIMSSCKLLNVMWVNKSIHLFFRQISTGFPAVCWWCAWPTENERYIPVTWHWA